MKRNTTPDAARFKIKYSVVIILLSVLVYALCALGIAASIWRIIKFGIRDFTDVTKYPFLIAICVFCIVFVSCVLANSYYCVTNGKLVTHFGFIKTTYDVKDIQALTLDCDTQKLTVTFANSQYMTLTVNAEWSEQLIRAILAENDAIDYSFTLSDAPKYKKDEDKK